MRFFLLYRLMQQRHGGFEFIAFIISRQLFSGNEQCSRPY